MFKRVSMLSHRFSRLLPTGRRTVTTGFQVPSTKRLQLYNLMEEGDLHEGREEEEEVGDVVVKEGVASIALLPSGSISGHFIHLPDSICYGLQGIEMACERECSRGDDYRLIKLTIIDYNRGKEEDVIVECKGHDAARFHTIDHVHGWGKDVSHMVEEKQSKKKVIVSFECETLKADQAAEDHLRQFMPKLAGLDAIVNVGAMKISGLDFDKDDTGQ